MERIPFRIFEQIFSERVRNVPRPVGAVIVSDTPEKEQKKDVEVKNGNEFIQKFNI